MYVPDRYKIQEMCDKVVLENDKTQKMGDKLFPKNLLC